MVPSMSLRSRAHEGAIKYGTFRIRPLFGRTRARRRRALRPQLKVVRGGGSVPDRSVECSGSGVSATSCVLIGSAGIPARPIDGITAPGQSVAQLGAHAGLQQSISSWSKVDEDDAAIGQSAAGIAKAGPEASARDKASTIKTSRRCMAQQLRQPALTCNYGSRTFAYGSDAKRALIGRRHSTYFRRQSCGMLVGNDEMILGYPTGASDIGYML